MRAIGQSERVDGKLIRLFGTFQDVDAQRHQRSLLEDSNARLQQTLTASTDFALMVTNLEGKITVFNAGSEALLGYAASEIVGRWHLNAFLDAKELALRLVELSEPDLVLDDVLFHLPNLNGSDSHEWGVATKEGEALTLRLTVTTIKSQDNRIIGYMVVAVDVTEKIKAQEAFLESEQRFRGAFKGSGLGTCIVGIDGRFIEVNEQCVRFFGYSEEALLTKTFQELTHPEDLEEDLRLLHETLDGKQNGYRLEKRYFHPDGHIIWARLNVSLVRGRDNEPLYFVSQVEDITETHRLSQELENVNERLRLATSVGRVGVYDWNVVEDILEWDYQMFELYGVSPDDFPKAV